MQNKTTNQPTTKQHSNQHGNSPARSRPGKGSRGRSAQDPRAGKGAGQGTGKGAKAKGPHVPDGEDPYIALTKYRKRANDDDRAAQTALIEYLDQHPEHWETLGNLARRAESVLRTIANYGDWLRSEATRRYAADLRRRFSRPSQSALEELAVDRAVACWLHLQYVELKCDLADGGTERAKLWLQRQQQAHRLYAAAEKSLLQLRTLLPSAAPSAAPAEAGTEAGTQAGAASLPEEEKNPQPAEKKKPSTPVPLPVVLPVPVPPSAAVSECPPAKFAGQNRVAQWTDPPSLAPAHAVASGSNSKPQANGHVP